MDVDELVDWAFALFLLTVTMCILIGLSMGVVVALVSLLRWFGG